MKEKWKSANSLINHLVARRNDSVRYYKFMIRIVLPFHLKNLARVEGEQDNLGHREQANQHDEQADT